MKKIILLAVLVNGLFCLNAQQPAGKKISENAGHSILNLLPQKMKTKDKNNDRDKVYKGQGFIGVTVHRDYGNGADKVYLEVINQSPSVGLVNKLIAQTEAANTGKYSLTVVNGYKALIQKSISESNSIKLELLLPVNNTLISLKATGVTEDELISMANTIPLSSIVPYL
jgi:hypothetical protein